MFGGQQQQQQKKTIIAEREKIRIEFDIYVINVHNVCETSVDGALCSFPNIATNSNSNCTIGLVIDNRRFRK